MRLASSVLVVPRPSPGTEHHIQLAREGQGSGLITGRECHGHTWYDSAEKKDRYSCYDTRQAYLKTPDL